jgi:hypothetical protein
LLRSPCWSLACALTRSAWAGQTYIFLRVNRYYLKTSREVKRIEAVARSPVFSHFSSTLAGLDTLRSHNAMKRFTRIYEHHQVRRARGQKKLP